MSKGQIWVLIAVVAVLGVLAIASYSSSHKCVPNSGLGGGAAKKC